MDYLFVIFRENLLEELQELYDNILLDKETLMKQYKMLNVDKDRIENIISNLKGLNKVYDIIAFTNEKRYQTFHYRNIYDNIYCTIWRERI